MNMNVFTKLSYGVYVVSSLDGQRPTGCIANSVMQITATPATIAVSMNHENHTNKCIRESGKFGLSILSEQTEAEMIGKFGFQSGKDINKFEDVDFKMQEGMPVITQACGYIICKVINTMETATHTVFLGEVVEGDLLEDKAPMTYAYYHQVIKGKSPKTAPTYIPEEAAKKSDNPTYVCRICNYVYDGDVPFEGLPEDYKCPICKQGKDKFDKK